MTDTPIELNNLTRYFGQKPAVQQLSLKIPRGGVFAFLGRNGAGKTTTIRMMLGLLDPTRGQSSILGCDSRELSPEIRGRVGYLAEGHHLYKWMTVKYAAQFQKAFYPKWNHDIFKAVTEHFSLDGKAKVKNLSRGERAGLCLALTLAPEPELLILDDPALGLDPVARRALLEAMVYVTRDKQRTIFFSSHLLTDVERVADRLAILDNGVLKANCTVDEFRNRLGKWIIRFDSDPPPAGALPDIPGLLQAKRIDNELHLVVANPNGSLEAAMESLNPIEILPQKISLEEAVISYLDRRQQTPSLLEAAGGVL